MSFKECLQKSVRLYFVLVTLITAAIMILGQIADPDARFGYSALRDPFVYAAAGVIPNFVMASGKELSSLQYIIRKLIQLIIVEAEIFAICFISPLIKNENIVFIALSVLAVFIAAHIINIADNYMAAKNMTDDLAKFQEKADKS